MFSISRSANLFGVAVLLLTTAHLPAQSTLTDSEVALIDDALVQNPHPDLLGEVIALGVDAVDVVEAYLVHPDRDVKGRALHVLANVDEVATAALTDALRSPDLDLVRAALFLAQPRLSLPAIAVEYIIHLTDPPTADLRLHAVIAMYAMDAATRDAVADLAVPEMAATLGQFDARSIAMVVVLLGRLALPGEPPVLAALADLRPDVAAIDDARLRAHAEQAILFAEANLGDPQALDAFEQDVRSGDPQAKRARLGYLDQFRPTPRMLRLALAVLDDTTELVRLSPIHRKRACDIAADTVGRWYPQAQAAIGDPRHYQYTERQRADAKAWLEQTLATGSP